MTFLYLTEALAFYSFHHLIIPFIALFLKICTNNQTLLKFKSC